MGLTTDLKDWWTRRLSNRNYPKGSKEIKFFKMNRASVSYDLKQPDIHVIGIPKEDKGQKNIWRSNGPPNVWML